MIRSRKTKLSYACICSVTGAALGMGAACSSDNNVTLAPADASATGGFGGSDGAPAGGSGGTGDAKAPQAQPVTMTNLTSDEAGKAANQDANLVNAWGLAINPNAPNGPAFWVVANGTGMAVVYGADGKTLPVKVTIPVPAGGTGTSGPTGQVFNDSTSSFMGDLFIFSTEEGTIAGWSTGANATMRADQSASEAIYKGLAIIDNAGAKMLAAPDFHNAKIDVFDENYAPVTTTDMFTDPAIPLGFAPFNIAMLDRNVYVAYAQQDGAMEDDVKGAGFGYVNVFAPDGTYVKRLVSQGALNAPWALTLAPSSFGAMAGSLLVGNFGDGTIHAYDKTTGEELGALVDTQAKPIAIEGLWALEPGPTGEAADMSGILFFTAGPNEEAHGLFGKLEVATPQ